MSHVVTDCDVQLQRRNDFRKGPEELQTILWWLRVNQRQLQHRICTTANK
jgi:hypothetical protein